MQTLRQDLRRRHCVQKQYTHARSCASKSTSLRRSKSRQDWLIHVRTNPNIGTLLQVVKTTNQFVTRTRSIFRLSTAYSERWGRLRKFAVGSILEPAVYTPCLVSYPYGGTIDFKTCIETQLRVHLSPIQWTFQAPAESDRYIGHSGNEAVGSPIKLKKNSRVRKADKSRTEKSSISNLWEHFLVSEHRSPIWLLLGSKFSSYSHGKPCNSLVKSTISHRNLIIPG